MSSCNERPPHVEHRLNFQNSIFFILLHTSLPPLPTLHDQTPLASRLSQSHPPTRHSPLHLPTLNPSLPSLQTFTPDRRSRDPRYSASVYTLRQLCTHTHLPFSLLAYNPPLKTVHCSTLLASNNYSTFHFLPFSLPLLIPTISTIRTLHFAFQHFNPTSSSLITSLSPLPPPVPSFVQSPQVTCAIHTPHTPQTVRCNPSYEPILLHPTWVPRLFSSHFHYPFNHPKHSSNFPRPSSHPLSIL